MSSFQISFILIILSVTFIPNNVRCNNVKEKSFATSVAAMEQLIFTEQLLIDTIDQFTQELEEKVNILKNLIFELRTENNKAIDNPGEYLSNPLNGYSLIRRMHHDWNHIELFVQKPVGESYLQVLQNYRQELPTSQDLYEASEAIKRLQLTYALKPADMSKGILNGKQYNVKLKSIDCFFLGVHLFGKNEYFPAAFWIHTSLSSYVATEYTRIVDYGAEKIWSLYAETMLKQNRPKDALISIKTACGIKPEDAALMKRKNEMEYLLKVNTEPEIQYEEYPPDAYELGCRGGYPPQLSSNLYCLYNFTTSPFLRLAPIKMEILEFDPYLVLFHDVIYDTEIKEIQELAKPNLHRATVYTHDVKKSEIVDSRTSKFSWFEDDATNSIKNINQRIRDMTGFDIKGAEMLQIMNYGMGGHYDTHFDYFNLSDTSEVVIGEGDRISTVLFYISDVEQGGATVFPNIQKAVFPRKGSAVMWYNLNNKLEADTRTLHAACPVIVGSKWVCNKWIRSKSQIFRKPCYKH